MKARTSTPFPARAFRPELFSPVQVSLRQEKKHASSYRGAPGCSASCQVLAAEVVELPRRAKFSTRTADISRTGCYIDTLNPIPTGSEIRLRISHHQEIFEAMGRVVYVSPGLGVAFAAVAAEQRARLDRWLAETGAEF